MAGGTLELADAPLVYRVRHVLPRAKQAQISTVMEAAAIRIASWSSDEAPEVGGLITPQMASLREGGIEGREVRYRAARGADGTVRLVAPLSSMAFPLHGASSGPFGFPDPNQAGNGREVAPGGVLGEIITSERAAAQPRLAALAMRLVSVDGEMHCPCDPPGWHLEWNNAAAPNDRELFSAVAGPGDYRSHGCFLPYVANPLPELAARFPATPGGARPKGSITEAAFGAFSTDRAWAGFRDALCPALYNDSSVYRMLFEDESAVRHSLIRAYHEWPISRNPALVTAGVRMARIVHGIRSNGNTGLVACVAHAAAALEATPAPRPLEDRLASAGVVIPRPGDAPDPGGPRP